MSDHFDDNLRAEEFDLEEVDAASLTALFSDSAKPSHARAKPGDTLVELGDDEDGARPSPVFGPLGPEDADERPLVHKPAGVFEPLTHEEQTTDDVELPPIPGRHPAASAGPPIEIDEFPQEDYEQGGKKLSLKDKAAIARKEMKEGSGSKSKPKEPKREKPVKAPKQDAGDDTEAKPAKLSLRQRLSIAKEQAAGSKKPDQATPAAGAHEEEERPAEIVSDEDGRPVFAPLQPESPTSASLVSETSEETSDEHKSRAVELATDKPRKMSLRERVAYAKREATGADKQVEVSLASATQGSPAEHKSLRERLAHPGSIDEPEVDDDTSLVDIDLDDESEPAEKLTLRERAAVLKQDARSRRSAKTSAEPGCEAAETVGADELQSSEREGDSQDQADSKVERLRAFWTERKRLAGQASSTKAKKPAVFAGADVAAPGRLARVRDRLRLGASTSSKSAGAGASRFAELLTPLSSAEVQLLQQDVRQETPMFVVLDRASRLGAARQRAGMLVGLLVTAWFALKVGGDYLNSTLPNAAQNYHPTWLHLTASPRDMFNGLWFGVGLVMPLVAGFILAEAVNYIWRGLSDWRLDDLALGFWALVCSGAIYVVLFVGNSLVAALLLVAWLLSRGVTRILRSLVRGGKR